MGARKLGLWMATALVVGNMVGSGVFLLPSSLAIYGPISLVGWVLTALGAVALALVFGVLSRANPAQGGPYAYAREGFGDFAGFLVAWGYWISLWSGNAAIAVAFVGYLSPFWPQLAAEPGAAALVAIAVIWLLTVVNAVGVRTAGVVQLVTTIVKLAPLVAVALVGLAALEPVRFTPLNASGEPAVAAIVATASLTLWAFLGLESATIPAESVERPERIIPLATVAGTLVAAAVYICGTAAVLGVLDRQVLLGSTAPFADAATALWGGWAGRLVGIGAAVSCFGALNGWILLGGQVPMTIARDGLFPAVFKGTTKNRTPLPALLICAVLMTIMVVLNYSRGLVGMFTFIILLATLTTLVPYVFSSLALLLTSFRRRAEVGSAWLRHGVVAAVAFLYSILAIIGAGVEALLWGAILLLVGVPVFLRLAHARQ